MACSLSGLQSCNLRDASNKTLSNFDSLAAGFSHVLISVSVSKNMAVACLALYNSTSVSSAATCQHWQRWPFSIVNSLGWQRRKSRWLWRQQPAMEGMQQITCSLALEDFFPLTEAYQRKGLFLENVPEPKPFYCLGTRVSKHYLWLWITLCPSCPFLKSFRSWFCLKIGNTTKIKNCGLHLSTKDNCYCFQ